MNSTNLRAEQFFATFHLHYILLDLLLHPLLLLQCFVQFLIQTLKIKIHISSASTKILSSIFSNFHHHHSGWMNEGRLTNLQYQTKDTQHSLPDFLESSSWGHLVIAGFPGRQLPSPGRNSPIRRSRYQSDAANSRSRVLSPTENPGRFWK